LSRVEEAKWEVEGLEDSERRKSESREARDFL